MIDDFLVHATADQNRAITLQAIDDQGTPIHQAQFNARSGAVITLEDTIDVATQEPVLSPLIQFRKKNQLQLTPDPARHEVMIQTVEKALATTNYQLSTPARRNAIQRIIPEALQKSRVLLCMDSYGNSQAPEQYTTPNVTTVALPGARLATVVKAAQTLSRLAMDAPTEIIIFASTNDYLMSHQRRVARGESGIDPRDAEEAAEEFVDQLTTIDLGETKNHAQVFYVAPLQVDMPILADKDHKARCLRLFNARVRSLLKTRVEHGARLPIRIVFVEQIWWLSADQVHIRAHQFPLLLMRIEQAVHAQHDALPPMIDNPEAGTNLFYRGHLAHRRVDESDMTISEKRTALRRLAAEETSTLKRYPMNEPCKQLDDYQVPSLTPALTTANASLQATYDELMAIHKHKNTEVLHRRRKLALQPNYIQPVGPVATRLQFISKKLYQSLSQNSFLYLVAQSIRQLTTNNALHTIDVVEIHRIFDLSPGWLAFDEYVDTESKIARKTSMKRQNESTSTPSCKIRMLDISLRDLIIMTILFPRTFDQGPRAFWPAPDAITTEEWFTFVTLLDKKTVQYIAYGQSRLDTIKSQTRLIQLQWLAWIRNILNSNGGGICQAQLEYETGLHLTHLKTALTPQTLTVILGRKSHNPLSSPDSYRDGDVNTFFFVTYMSGTPFLPKSTGLHIIWGHEHRLWVNGHDTLCDAETETMRALGPLSIIYTDTMAAVTDARTAMSKPKERTIAPVTQTSRPVVITIAKGSAVQCTTVPGIGPVVIANRDPAVHDADDSENDNARRSARPHRTATLTSARPQQRSDIPPPPPPPPSSIHPPTSSKKSRKRKHSKKSRAEARTSSPASPVRKHPHCQPKPMSDVPSDDGFVVETSSRTREYAHAMTPSSTSQATTISYRSAEPSATQQAVNITAPYMPPSSPHPTLALGEGVFGTLPKENAAGCMDAKRGQFSQYISNPIRFGPEDDEDEQMTLKKSSALGVEREVRKKQSTYHIQRPVVGGRQYVHHEHSWVMQTHKHMYRTLQDSGWLPIEANEEQWAQLASSAGKVRGSDLPRICLGCGQTLPEVQHACNCELSRRSTVHMYVRCIPDQLTKLIHSIMRYPRSQSGQNEKLMSVMNTKSWENVFGTGKIVGLDVKTWQCDLTIDDDDLLLQVYDLKSSSGDDEILINTLVCVKAAMTTMTDGEPQTLMAQRYQIPAKKTRARLTHPRASATSSRICKFIDNLMQKDQGICQDVLEEEKNCFKTAWRGAKGHRGGTAILDDSKMNRVYKYLKRGYRDATWHKKLDESDRNLTASLVEVEDNLSTLTVHRVESENPEHCAFSAVCELQEQLLTLTPSTLATYNAEDDLNHLGIRMGQRHAVMDTTLTMPYRHIMSHKEEYELSGLDLVITPQDLIFQESVERSTLFEDWKTITFATDDDIALMQQGKHGTATDSIMIQQVATTLYQYRKKHADIFDLIAPLEIDREAYIKLMNQTFEDSDTLPLKRMVGGKGVQRLLTAIQDGDLHSTICTHVSEDQ